jgi:hypothetical protein
MTLPLEGFQPPPRTEYDDILTAGAEEHIVHCTENRRKTNFIIFNNDVYY